MGRIRQVAFALAFGLVGWLVAPVAAHEPDAGAPATAAESSFGLRFEPPRPGSYELPSIGTVGAHSLLDAEGRRVEMLDLEKGELALVSFVYASCPEGYGCPFALSVFQSLDRRLAQRPELAEQVELVTVSFDPARDTPERMRTLREALRPAGRWRFLTAASEEEIAPVLADYGQDVLALTGEDGEATGLLRHVLKVFLVDSSRRVRNVYSVGFLAPELLLNDLETLRLEAQRSRQAAGSD